MVDLPRMLTKAQAQGFDHAGELLVSTLEFLPEVRQMCAADRCRSYGKNWTCPPNCGSLERSKARASAFSKGLLVQTVGKLEDDFDYETMESTAHLHQQRFQEFVEELKSDSPGLLAMGAGACSLCDSCTCPDEPCRFPERAITSMEAYGLFVSQVCESNKLAYNRGPLTVTYTSCVLLE